MSSATAISHTSHRDVSLSTRENTPHESANGTHTCFGDQVAQTNGTKAAIAAYNGTDTPTAGGYSPQDSNCVWIRRDDGRVILQAVGAVVVSSDGRVLLGRVKGSDFWKMPAGGVEHQEALVDACDRELEEEVGLRANEHVRLIAPIPHDQRFLKLYPVPRAKPEWGNRLFDGREIHWFLYHWPRGDVSECDLTDVSGNEEFTEVRLHEWSEIFAGEHVVPLKRELYKCIFEHIKALPSKPFKLPV